MKSKKIHLALEYLNIHEINSFKKFLHSPYFNQNEKILRYFIVLERQIKAKLPLADLKNQDVWSEVMENNSYNDAKFRKLNSDISKLFEKFMAISELENDITLSNNLKIRAFREKKMSKLYPGLISHINNAKKAQQNRSADYYLDLFNIEKSIFSLQSDADRKSKSKDPVKFLNIEEISQNLDVFYIAEKLKYYCTILSWKRSYKVDKKIAGIEFILKLAQIPMFSEYPPVKIYFTISRTITESENTEHYYLLKNLIEEYIHLFPPSEAREIMEAAISYCVVKNNQGITLFLNEVLELYTKGLKNEIIFDNGFLSPIAFRNIAFYALRAKRYDWAEKFISEYHDKIKEEYRSNAKNFSFARLEFYRKDYSKVIDYLNQIIMNDSFYNINVRSLLLVSYYELEEWAPLESLLQSFKAWVTREKSLSKHLKNRFLELIKSVKKLVYTPEFEKEKLKKLLNNVQDNPEIINKPWLVNKILDKLSD